MEPIAVSAHKKSRAFRKLHFFHEKLRLYDQIRDLQGLKQHYPHLSNLPNQSYNLNENQVNLRQDSYDIPHTFEIKKSDNKTAPLAVSLKSGWALSGPLPAMQAATLATTAISITEDKLASHLEVRYLILHLGLRCHRCVET